MKSELWLSLFLMWGVSHSAMAQDPPPSGNQKNASTCIAHLMPPKAIQASVVNFISQAAAALSSHGAALQPAAALTQALFQKISANQIKIELDPNQTIPFKLRVRYPWTGTSFKPELEKIVVSPKLVQSLFDAGKNSTELLTTSRSVNPTELRAWVEAAAEFFTEHEYENHNTSLENINLWSTFETKSYWGRALEKAMDAKQRPLLSERKMAEHLWPWIAGLVREKNYRKLVVWFGLACYETLAMKQQAIAAKLDSTTSMQLGVALKLTRQMGYARNNFKTPILELGERAATLLAAQDLVDYPDLAALSTAGISAKQAKSLVERARVQFDELYGELANILEKKTNVSESNDLSDAFRSKASKKDEN